MKYTTDQLILAAHVRTLAIDFWKAERNSLSDDWHKNNPGQDRLMADFATELGNSKSFNEFIIQAMNELENIASIMLEPPTAKVADQR